MDDPARFIQTFRFSNREPAPDPAVILFDGREISLQKQKDKVVFVSFFSPNCGTCRHEIPILKSLYEN